MATRPLSIRFDAELLDRLRRRAAGRDATPSGLAQRLVDEGLRSHDFPGVVFRDGASGRRAGLAAGPDVWEVVVAVRDAEQRGEAAIESATLDLGVTSSKVRTALAYYGMFADEIDAEIAENERAADDALRSWMSQQHLIA